MLKWLHFFVVLPMLIHYTFVGSTRRGILSLLLLVPSVAWLLLLLIVISG